MTHQHDLTIRSAQINPKVGAISANCELIEQAIRQAQADHIELIVFPEMALIGYPPQDLLWQPDCQQYCQQALQQLLPLTERIAVIIGAPQIIEGNLYNAAYYLYQGQIQQVYQKQILPNYGVFDEKRYFQPGSDTNNIILLNNFRLGIMICEDLWDDMPTQSLSQKHPDAIITLNASPYSVNKFNKRINLASQRGQQCCAPLLYVNLVGGQDDLLFDGRSFALDHNQDLLAQSPAFIDSYCDYQLSPQKITCLSASTTSQDDNAILYAGLTTALRDYINKNRFPGVIVGLSGGIDSAFTLALAVDALGAEHVQAVMMPSVYTSQLSLDLAQQQVDLLNVDYTSLAIDNINQGFLDSLGQFLDPQNPGITEENIQARIRGVLLMALSNQLGYMVLATGNKSEIATGYATLYGDMVGGFTPLKDVYKTTVYQLADYRNQLSPAIPQGIIDRAPSAELADNQQDTDSLPPYPILDDIIQRFVEQQQSIHTIIDAGYEPALIKQVIKLIVNNEYKRHQGAPGPKISNRAFERERRYPITSGLTDWLI